MVIFIVKTDKNYLLVFWHFSATVAWKNVVSVVRCLVTTFWLITTLCVFTWK